MVTISFSTSNIFKLLSLFFISQIYSSFAQSNFSGMEHLFTNPKQYTVVYNAKAPIIDGKLDDELWQNIPWTDNFADIEGDKNLCLYGIPALK